MTPTEKQVVEFIAKRARDSWPADQSDAVVYAPIARWGLTSLEIVEVVMDAEQCYGIEIPDSSFSDTTTVAALAAEIDRRRFKGAAVA